MNGKSSKVITPKAKADRKILYYGSCWPTNIGNSFVNLGAIQSIKMALSEDADILHFGGFSSYLFTSKGRRGNCLQIGDLIPCDYLVMAGMTMCNNHFESQYEILKQFEERNVKIIILGGGADKYDTQEIKKVRKWMKKIKIHA